MLAWAHAHPGAEAIIDDLAGRRCAAAFSIPVRGTLGLALIAKQLRPKSISASNDCASVSGLGF